MEPSLHPVEIHPSLIGALGVIEFDLIPFIPRRCYWVSGVPNGQIRGQHAHKTLSQLLVVSFGEVEVETINRLGERHHFRLTTSEGLLIPPGNWREITFSQPETSLVVFASAKYDEADYIRDFKTFEEWAGI